MLAFLKYFPGVMGNIFPIFSESVRWPPYLSQPSFDSHVALFLRVQVDTKDRECSSPIDKIRNYRKNSR